MQLLSHVFPKKNSRYPAKENKEIQSWRLHGRLDENLDRLQQKDLELDGSRRMLAPTRPTRKSVSDV